MTETNKNGHPRILDYILYDGSRPFQSINFITEPNPPLKEDRDGQYNLRGIKIKTDLLGSKDNKLVHRRLFTEEAEDKCVKIEFQVINDDDTIKSVKTKTVEFSDSKWETRKRKQRERIMDDLKGRANKYNAGFMVDVLYSFFADEKIDFEQTGSTIFADAVQDTVSLDAETLPKNTEEEINQYNEVVLVKNYLNQQLDPPTYVYQTMIYLTTL